MFYIISNCTNAKKIIPKPEHMFRNHCISNPFYEISSKWNEAIKKSTVRIKAKELYKGISWKASLDIKEILEKRHCTKLYIASAGYGLINENTDITPYSITFSKESEDSIHHCNDIKNSQQWWENINTIGLDEFEKAEGIFIVVSKDYLKAMTHFISSLIGEYEDRVFIITAFHDVSFSKNYKKNILQFDTRFNQYEPGTLTSLVQRCARWLSLKLVEKKLPLDHKILQEEIDCFLNQYKHIKKKDNIQKNDDEIKKIIIEQILNEKISSVTKGLKKLRLRGVACEQKRYGKLFKNIKESL